MRLKLTLKTNLLRAIGIGYSQNLQNKCLIHHLVCPQRIVTRPTRRAGGVQLSTLNDPAVDQTLHCSGGSSVELFSSFLDR